MSYIPICIFQAIDPSSGGIEETKKTKNLNIYSFYLSEIYLVFYFTLI